MEIIQKNWQFPKPLSARNSTKYIVVHHTAGPQNQDTDEIWQEHCNLGWNGIGYNRVIKGDGTTVQGRPDWAIGAHAQGVNSCSVGVTVEGNFEAPESDMQPTTEQIAALKDNLCDLLAKYPDAQIIGHREVAEIIGDSSVATACPGSTLFAMLPDIIAEVS